MKYVVVIDGQQTWVKTKKAAHAAGNAARASGQIAFVYSRDTYETFITASTN